MKLSARLAHRRGELASSQRAYSEKLGLSLSWYHKLEKGEVKLSKERIAEIRLRDPGLYGDEPAPMATIAQAKHVVAEKVRQDFVIPAAIYQVAEEHSLSLRAIRQLLKIADVLEITGITAEDWDRLHNRGVGDFLDA